MAPSWQRLFSALTLLVLLALVCDVQARRSQHRRRRDLSAGDAASLSSFIEGKSKERLQSVSVGSMELTVAYYSSAIVLTPENPRCFEIYLPREKALAPVLKHFWFASILDCPLKGLALVRAFKAIATQLGYSRAQLEEDRREGLHCTGATSGPNARWFSYHDISLHAYGESLYSHALGFKQDSPPTYAKDALEAVRSSKLQSLLAAFPADSAVHAAVSRYLTDTGNAEGVLSDLLANRLEAVLEGRDEDRQSCFDLDALQKGVLENFLGQEEEDPELAELQAQIKSRPPHAAANCEWADRLLQQPLQNDAPLTPLAELVQQAEEFLLQQEEEEEEQEEDGRESEEDDDEEDDQASRQRSSVADEEDAAAKAAERRREQAEAMAAQAHQKELQQQEQQREESARERNKAQLYADTAFCARARQHRVILRGFLPGGAVSCVLEAAL